MRIRIRSRLVAASVVTLATLIICCLGVRAELARAQRSADKKLSQESPKPNAARPFDAALADQPPNL